ncbi:MAG: MFS transporter [Bacteroidetes bacterium]|nr:MFS transporter [Bacteroidota bacterium]
MKQANWPKFPVLFSLYIAQSVPMSFFSTVVPVIMRQENYSLESIGLLQLVKLPWILKFLWAPLVDNNASTMRQYKRWIYLSEFFYALIILHIGFFSLQTDFTLIVALMLIAFTASATQDIATDAFAILLLKKNERSLGNSMQSAGSFIGTLLGSGVLLIVYYYLGWYYLLICLALFVLIALIPLRFVKLNEPKAQKEKLKVSLGDLISFFKVPGIPWWILLLFFYYSGIIGILAMLKPWLVDLGYTAKDIGFMAGIFGTAIAAVSAMGAGWFIKKAGKKIALYSFLTLSLLAGVYFYFISMQTPGIHLIYLGIFLLWSSYGMSTVAIYTSSMDLVRSGREGTDFTLQIVITHLSGLIMAILSGKVADVLGYTNLFLIEIMFSILAMIILTFSLKKVYKHHEY